MKNDGKNAFNYGGILNIFILPSNLWGQRFTPGTLCAKIWSLLTDGRFGEKSLYMRQRQKLDQLTELYICIQRRHPVDTLAMPLLPHVERFFTKFTGYLHWEVSFSGTEISFMLKNKMAVTGISLKIVYLYTGCFLGRRLNLFIGDMYNRSTCPLQPCRGHGGRVVTLSPPTSAAGDRSPSWP